MASTINAKTTGVGGIDASGDASGVLALQTGGTTAVTIDASQNVGIGTSSPTGKLHTLVSGANFLNVQSTTNLAALQLQSATGVGTYIISSSNGIESSRITTDPTGVIAFSNTASTVERMRIDSSGNVGIGTIPNAGLLTGNKFEINAGALGTTAGNISAATILDANDGNATVLQTYNYRVSNGSSHLTSEWRQQRIVDVTRMGYIGYGSSYISFGQNTTEQMRIDSSGNVLVGTTSGGAKINVTSTSTTTSPFSANSPASFVTGNYISNSITAAGTGWFHFYATSSNNTIQNCIIYGNGNIQNANNSYGALSDAKLKENIVDATPKLDKLMQVKIRNYNLKGDYEQFKQIGVVAQELETVFPSLIEETEDKETVTKTREVDGVEEEYTEQVLTGETTKAVKYSVFVPILIKAIQELKAIIDTQQQRITALEAK